MDGTTTLAAPLHLVSTKPARLAAAHPPVTLPLQPDWQCLLSDLTTFGVVRVAVGNRLASLNCSAEPWYIARQDDAMQLRGPGIAIAALTNRWTTATISRDQPDAPFEQLTIHDLSERELLRVRLTEESARSGFHALLVRQWARRAAPGAVRHANTITPRELDALQACCRDWTDGELQHGWHGTTHPQHPGSYVDPTLLVPFLETMVDQVCPLRVTLGNNGLLQRHDNSYFDMRLCHDRLQLRSCTSTFTLDIGGISHARRMRTPAGDGTARIHLYDQSCRCVTGLGLASDADGRNLDLWQSMIRALAD